MVLKAYQHLKSLDFKSLALRSMAKEVVRDVPLTPFVGAELGEVNQTLKAIAKNHVSLIPQLAEHITKAGGKRLRPMLTLACGVLCDAPTAVSVKLAAAVECIHTATLLHDDVVDESPLRRGVATANALWGNKPSVLVGDYLFAKSFELMVGAGSLAVLEILARASSVIAEGEVLQLETLKARRVDREVYLRVIEAKTAALFAAACEVAPVAADKPEWRGAFAEYGRALGVAFQMVDDVLDLTTQSQKLGKRQGDDYLEGKWTLPMLLVAERASKAEAGWLRERMLAEERSPDEVARVLLLAEGCGAIEAAWEEAGDYAKKAVAALRAVPDHPVKQALVETAWFAVTRKF